MVTGYTVTPCPFCGTRQEFLHLHTARPCMVRCGHCGAHGPTADTPDAAVEAWNSGVVAGRIVRDASMLANELRSRAARPDFVAPSVLRDIAVRLDQLVTKRNRLRLNCEVGSPDEQAARFHKFCMDHQSGIDGMCSPSCPLSSQSDQCHCLCHWMQLPADPSVAERKPLCERSANEVEVEAGDGRIRWCSVCTADCVLRGRDALVICSHSTAERGKEQ